MRTRVVHRGLSLVAHHGAGRRILCTTETGVGRTSAARVITDAARLSTTIRYYRGGEGSSWLPQSWAAGAQCEESNARAR